LVVRGVQAGTAATRAGSTEDKILRVALELFAERGFGATSLRRIAGEAGVTPPLVAYHFDSKEGLFVACAEAAMRALASQVEGATATVTSLSDMVLKLAEVHVGFSKQHAGEVRLLLSVAYGPNDGHPQVDLVSPWAATMESVHARLAAAIDSRELVARDGADAVQLTRHLFNLLHMAVFEGFERERFCHDENSDTRFCGRSETQAQDIHDQFFTGAGRLTVRPDSKSVEGTR